MWTGRSLRIVVHWRREGGRTVGAPDLTTVLSVGEPGVGGRLGAAAGLFRLAKLGSQGHTLLGPLGGVVDRSRRLPAGCLSSQRKGRPMVPLDASAAPKGRRVRSSAENNDVMTPMLSVTAKPLRGPAPK
jgi:hypothetical protein